MDGRRASDRLARADVAAAAALADPAPPSTRAEAERAVAGVREAFARGYGNIEWVRRGDPDLKPIRRRPGFQMLMMDLIMPADPFVPNR